MENSAAPSDPSPEASPQGGRDREVIPVAKRPFFFFNGLLERFVFLMGSRGIDASTRVVCRSQSIQFVIDYDSRMVLCLIAEERRTRSLLVGVVWVHKLS